MTCQELAGRELDAACARAMGWRDIDNDPRAKLGKGPGDGCLRVFPRYATDAATLPEKLAWLRNRMGKHFGYVDMTTWSPFNCEGDTEGTKATYCGASGDFEASGSTIDEAVARLVVAVADAEAGAKR